MTTSLPQFIEKIDIHAFPAGNLTAIPHEIKNLLDEMIAQS